MKKNDFSFLVLLVAFFSPFFVSETAQYYFNTATAQYPVLTSFTKFAILATLGEIIGLRISQGVYHKKGFGLLPRAIFWGFTGVLIKIAFTIFAAGSPVVVDHFLYKLPENVLAGGLTPAKILAAFSVSALMNTLFAPVFMTLHKISDIHIEETGGTLSGYFSQVDIARILKKINWSVMWGFVFKKTLPLFWIPAHTITFLLPPNLQIVFAAALGIVLGLILALAGMSKQKELAAVPAV